jgi:hypothetical protein
MERTETSEEIPRDREQGARLGETRARFTEEEPVGDRRDKQLSRVECHGASGPEGRGMRRGNFSGEAMF